jgi:thiol-disulfide isomerase/thioredoxin
MTRKWIVLTLLAMGCIPRLYSPEKEVTDWVAPDNDWPVTEPPAGLEEEGFAIGEVVPDFLLMDQHGQNVSIWQFYDMLVAVDVSTMWCAPCQELASEAEETYQEFKGDGFIHLTILPQNLEGDTPTQENLNQWADAFDLNVPVVADTDGIYSTPLVGSEAFPVVILLDRDLTVRQKIQPPTDEQLRLAIEDAL